MTRSRPLGLAAALVVGLLAAPAAADPLLGAEALTPVSSRLLAEQLRLDRRVHPAAWQRVADLQGIRPEVYLATRLRRPSVSRELREMGAEALLPLLDLLVGGGLDRAMSDDERAALTLGALEAVAAQRDPRAAGALRAAFNRVHDPAQLRAAARGVAALGTPDDLAFLVARLATPGPHALAALEGLGALRARASLDLAATVLRAAHDPATITAAARALGEIGSSWAQRAERGDASLPAAAAEALVPAYLRAPEGSRDALQVAILACGSPRAAELLRAALSSLDARAQQRVRYILRALQRGG
jgi:alkylhydroperoxidase/carboxymuconolactone decarboxylase family protein YurZ